MYLTKEESEKMKLILDGKDKKKQKEIFDIDNKKKVKKNNKNK